MKTASQADESFAYKTYTISSTKSQFFSLERKSNKQSLGQVHWSTGHLKKKILVERITYVFVVCLKQLDHEME